MIEKKVPLIQFGPFSLGIVIPKDWINYHKLTVGDTLILQLDKNITIKPEP